MKKSVFLVLAGFIVGIVICLVSIGKNNVESYSV